MNTNPPSRTDLGTKSHRINPAIAAMLETDFARSLHDRRGVMLIRPDGSVLPARDCSWGDLEDGGVSWLGMSSADAMHLIEQLDDEEQCITALKAFAIYDGSESRLSRLYRGLAYEVFAGIPGNRVLGAAGVGVILSAAIAIAAILGVVIFREDLIKDILDPALELGHADRGLLLGRAEQAVQN